MLVQLLFMLGHFRAHLAVQRPFPTRAPQNDPKSPPRDQMLTATEWGRKGTNPQVCGAGNLKDPTWDVHPKKIVVRKEGK